MDARNSIANDLFYKVRSRFTGLKLGTETGTITINPEEARFFDFDYKDGEVPMGHVTISLAEPNSMKVYFSSGITESMETGQKKKWYSFLKELREFAKRRLMAFDTRDIAKDNLDRRDFEFLTTISKPTPAKDTILKSVGESVMNESQLYGTKTVSYQKLMDTRLIIKHSHAVMDDTQPGARSRNISALFVENQDGERFKYPFIHLAGARAMQRHVANGGLPYDEIGKSIIGMSEQIAQLRSFNNYVVRNDLMNSDTNSIVERSSQALNNLREQVARLAKQSHYSQYKESFHAQQELEVPEEVIEDFTNKFTVRNFKEDLKTVFPILYRLMQEDSIVEYDDIVAMTTENYNDEAEIDLEEEQDELANFENWIMGLGESSPIQSDENQLMAIENLNKLIAQAFPAGVDGTNAIESLKGIIDDPKLYKEIKDASKQNPQEDVRPMIQVWVQENSPEIEAQLDFGDMAAAEQPQGVVDPTAAAGETEIVATAPAPGTPPATESIVKEDGVDTFTIDNPNFDPDGPEDEDDPNFESEEIDVEVEWEIEGSYRPATWGYHGGEPPEYPEVILKSVKNVETGEELIQKISGKTEDYLIDQISEREHDSGYGADDRDYDDYDYRESQNGDHEQINTKELAEFIQSFYDKESGTFPKGPEGVCTMVGKKFGEKAESVARKFVERMAPRQEQGAKELAELSRMRELAGVQNEGDIDVKDVPQFKDYGPGPNPELEDKITKILKRFEDSALERYHYGDVSKELIQKVAALIEQGETDDAVQAVSDVFGDKDGDAPDAIDDLFEYLRDEFEELADVFGESSSPELEDIRRLSGIAQGIGFK